MIQKRHAPAFAVLLALGIGVFLILNRDDGSEPESVEITKVPVGGLYSSVAVALQDVPPTGDRTAWSRSWCHPSACPDDASLASFADRQAAPHIPDLPACVTDRRTLYVFKGWTQRDPNNVATEHIVIDCRPVARKLHVQAQRAGTNWKLVAMKWEALTPQPPLP